MKRHHLTFFLIFLIACGGDNPQQINETEGEFLFLTYNVAGLPVIVSGRNPEINMPRISSLLNDYDIVVVQEDFFYHNLLKAQTNHKYQSEPKADKNAFRSGDGLNRFSRFPFRKLIRVPWLNCSDASGFDCQAKKGFSVVETEIATIAEVMIYNVHLDAGGEPADISARASQIDQLISDIKTRSNNKAVILAGDLNLEIDNRPDDLIQLNKLKDECGLEDACWTQNCNTELVDRILFRSSDTLELILLEWEVDDSFVDESGEKLSDHFAVKGKFSWILK